MGSRQLVIRAGRRCAFAVAALILCAAAGSLDIGSTSSPSPARSNAQLSTRTADGTATATDPAASGYTLHTRGGPRSARVARVVTATMLLTGLVLTALGAIGMRGPALIRRNVHIPVRHHAGATRYRWPAPGTSPANVPAGPGTGAPGA